MNITKIISSLPSSLRKHKLIKLLLLISPNSKIQLVEFNDCAKLYADVSNPYYRQYLITQSFHPYFFAIAKPFMSQGGVFFDIGANFGFCSFGIIGSLPNHDIKYHLFEANNDISQTLIRSAQLHNSKEININHCCISNSEGVSYIKIVKEQLGESFISNEGTQTVRNIVLDKYIEQNKISKINLLKIDIEGYEMFAIKGALNSLNSGKVDAIYIEISSQNLARYGFAPSDCFNILKDVGFQLFYCKESDFNSDFLDKNKLRTLRIHENSLKVIPLEHFPTNYHTDILAVHLNLLESCQN